MLKHRRSLALNPNAMDVPMFGGQDSGVDPRVLQPGSSAVVENGRLTVRGQVRKRYGFTNVPRRDIRSGEQVFSGGSVLFEHDGNTVWAYDEQLQSWTDLGRSVGGQIKALGTIQSTNSVSQVSSAVIGNLMLIAWNESAGPGVLYYCVVDINTGVQLVPRTTLAAMAQKPEVVVMDNTFCVFYGDLAASAILRVTFIPAVLPLAPSLSAGLTGIISVNTLYDATADALGEVSFIVESVSDPTVYEIYVLRFTGPGTFETELVAFLNANFTGDPYPAQPSIYPLPPWPDNLGGIGGDPRCAASVNGQIVFVSSTGGMGTGQKTLPTVDVRATASGFTLFIQTTTGGILPCTLTPFATPGDNLKDFDVTPNRNPVINQIGMQLIGRGASYGGNDFVSVNVNYELQSIDMILDKTGAVVAISGANGGGAPGTSNYPSLSSSTDNGSGEFSIASRYLKTVQETETGQLQTTIGIALKGFTLGQKHIYAEQIDGVTYMGCSAPQIYDGSRMTEWGFYFYPQISAATAGVAGTGLLNGGIYDVSACYSWYDATGKVWRSATSFFETVTVPSTGSITVTVPYLWLSTKQDVVVEIYCTANVGGQTGSILYQVASFPNLPPQFIDYAPVTPSTATVTISRADLDLADELQLYTNGGAPDHITPPSLVHMSTSGLRHYGCCSEDNQVYVTSPAIPGQPLDFLFSQSVAVETRRGGLVASQPQDGNLWIFTLRALFLTNADINSLGVTNAGNVVLFSPPARAAFGDGCASAESVYAATDGIYYQSSRGIEIVTRNQQAVFVGEPVKNVTGTILDTYSVPSQQQIRFLYPNQLVCYDYERRNWVQYTFASMPEMVSGCSWNGLGVALTSNGVTRLEDTSTFFDDGEMPIVMRLQTPWLRLGGLAGWGKAWEFVVLGEQITACDMQVQIAYNDDPTWIDTLTIPSALIGAPFGGGQTGAFGQTLNVSQPSMFGNNPAGNAYKWLGIIPRADGNSFKFEFQTLNSGGEDIRLNYMTLIYGLQPGGLAQFPTARKFG